MPAFEIANPWVSAGTALEDFMVQRELLKRQRLLDQLAQDKALSEAEDRKLARETQRQQLELSKKTAEAATRTHDFTVGKYLADTALPDQPVTPDLEAAYGKVPGLLDLATRRVDQTPGEFLGQDPGTGQDYFGDPSAGRLVTRGGEKWLAREDAQAAARELAAQRAADTAEREKQRAADRAQADADRRAWQESQNALNRNIQQQGVDIRAEAERRQQTTAEEKRAEKTAVVQRAVEGAQAAAQDTLNIIDRLVDVDPKTGEAVGLKPGVGAQFGYGLPNVLQSTLPGILTGDAADRRADVNQLRSRAIVNLINEMKSQSRTGATGFGALNQAELRILENGATILSDPNISNEAALQELGRMRRPLLKLLAARGAPAPGAPAHPAGAPGPGTGRTIGRFQVVE